MNPRRVAAVHVKQKWVVMENGDVYPITNCIDRFGEETDNPDEAVACVAGKDDFWVTIQLLHFLPTYH